MAVGFPTKVDYNTGDVLSAQNMNDLSGTVNLLEPMYENQYAAGKNKIINGDFGVWQRGTSFTNPAINAYTADRWYVAKNGSGATVTVSQQTFTPGDAPVAGYEGQFFFRYAQSVAGTGATYNVIVQKIEDVRQLAGQTVTVSFWAKAASSLTLVNADLSQNFGSGGSSDVNTNLVSSPVITTSWTRYSYTVTVPSITGKTIGTGSSLAFRIFLPNNAIQTLDIWGVQVEAGSTSSSFQTATGTKQGELAACQRYYYYFTSGDTNRFLGQAITTSSIQATIFYPVTLRGNPTITYPPASEYKGFNSAGVAAAGGALASIAANVYSLSFTLSGIVGSPLVAGNAAMVQPSSNKTEISAEL
jgi:hypothetical protein